MRRLVAAVAALLLCLVAAPALAGPAVTPTVSTDWLAANLTAPGLVILDVRAAGDFARGHIPGAVATDPVASWRAVRNGVPNSFPDAMAVTALAGRLGIGADSSVVIVPAGGDNTELGYSTWIYWVLRYYGHDAVALLDGGTATWTAEGRPTATGASAPRPATGFVATARANFLAETDQVLAALGTGIVIIDARSAAQYAAGHIPGAIDLDNARLYDPARHRLKDVAGLLAELPPGLARDTPIIVYCNAGHWSSIVWVALHDVLGFTDVRLYEGSMGAWLARPGLPVRTGTAP